MPPVPLAARVVEVIADLGGSAAGRYRYGSGFIVRGSTVLTAAHVVAGAVSVTVRDPDKRAFPASTGPRFTGDVDGPGPDLALLEIDGPGPGLPPFGLARVDRDSPTGDPVKDCQVIGYPAFKERDTPDGPVRETADASGHVPVLEGLAGGLLSVQVTRAPRPLPPKATVLGQSEWSGMSGAPLLAGRLLLGVVSEHAAREGSSAITAIPLTALEYDSAHPGWGPGVPDPAAWWARLGVPSISALHRLPPRPEEPGRPAHGRLAGRWDPVDLGVHQVIGGGPLPAYVRRPHDELLRAVLDPAVPASRLVVVRGGSSTGKTRAAYEAVAGRLPGWQLDYPLNAAALKERLKAGIPAQTVLWLGELRQYADAGGGPAVLGRLADQLIGDGLLVITTVWPEQWTTYTAAARAGPGAADPAGTAGRLLERLPELTGQDPAGIDPARGGVIDVPDRFTAADLQAAARAGDPLLAEAAAAAAAAGQGGQVTQYLAGVPDLLRRYAGPRGDPYGQAVITAAMDATRLGHAGPLPAGLVQEAAVGYLTPEQRTTSIDIWRDKALTWATEELRGAVRALQPVPPPSGTGIAGYRVADYLDQHGRGTRQDQLGPPSLWDALTAHAAASDLTRLAQAARDRGLYRHTAALWTRAVTLGSGGAAGQLIGYVRQVGPGDVPRAAHWAAGHARLDDPGDVVWLLRELRAAGASDAITTLLARDPASHARLDDPRGVAALLQALRAAGASDAITTLLARDPAADARLDNPWGVSELLEALREAGASDAVTTLLARDPARHVSLDYMQGVAALLQELHAAGASDAVTTLATRAATRVSPDDPGGIFKLLLTLHRLGADDAVTALASRAAAHLELDPDSVAMVLVALRSVGAGDAAATLATRAADHAWLDPAAAAELLDKLLGTLADVRDDIIILLARDPAAHAHLDDPWGVAALLQELREIGDDDGVTTLLARNPAADARLDDPWGVAALLEALREIGASDAVTTLLARKPAADARLDDPWGVAALLEALREIGDDDGVTTLLARNPAADARLDDPWGVAALLEALREIGASDAVTTLLARNPAAHATLDYLQDNVAALLQALRKAGASDAATALASRAANAGMFDLFLQDRLDEAASYSFGREPDGTPSQPWKWQDPGS